MENEHRIAYKAGITRTPSDFLCQDGELAECINLTTDNEELKPMVQPVRKLTYTNPGGAPVAQCNYSVLKYVHKFNGTTRYIIAYHFPISLEIRLAWTEDGETINYFLNEDESILRTSNPYARNIIVTSIGATLIIKTPEGLSYFLWETSAYLNRGEMPKLDVDFCLKSSNEDRKFHVYNTGKTDKILKGSGQIEDGEQDAYNDFITGLYLKNKKAIAQKKAFCEPFFVRAAIELFDGTYTQISQPILLWPAITKNSGLKRTSKEATLYTGFCQLMYVNRSDMGKWGDIIKGIAVFITEGIDIYDLNVDQPQPNFGNAIFWDAIFTKTTSNRNDFYKVSFGDPIDRCLKERDANDIKNDVKSASLYYKICNISKNGDGEEKIISQELNIHTLENLTTLERLEYDDYYSRNKLYPEFMYAYNSRLNVANIKRGFFEGFDYFMPWDNLLDFDYTFFVTIKTDSGNKVVKHVRENVRQMQGMYFYYPDPRATHVKIFRELHPGSGNPTQCVLDVDLEEHSRLNGAYYFRGLPEENWIEPVVAETTPSYDNSATEMLPNYVLTSDVNNPWIFPAAGYNMIGTDAIVAISSITQALSQDQRGPSPLLVFTEGGIWAMSVDNTGLFEYISSVSRDICINPGNILQTDNAVFFISKKGLMVAAQAGDNRNIIVSCLSERINGLPCNAYQFTDHEGDWNQLVLTCSDTIGFLEYIRSNKLIMAYDYLDASVIMQRTDSFYAYVYNISDGTISKAKLPIGMQGAVNCYPDYLIHSSAGIIPSGGVYYDVYSFYDKPADTEVTTRSTAFLLTRPMKLSGPVSKASLRQLKNVGMWDEANGSKVKTKVYVSDDLQNWYEAESRFGAAAKYYRLSIHIKMLPTERLSGTILTSQDRRTNNFR